MRLRSRHRFCALLASIACFGAPLMPLLAVAQAPERHLQPQPMEGPYLKREGFVDSNGVMIYFESVGRGAPLVVLHGGPGSDHLYFLPYLVPLARHHQLIFVDERGCGQTSRLRDPAGYTLENMTDDVEAVRRALGLGKISLLGHSFGGILAQAYALKYQHNLSHLILASTSYSAQAVNADFRRIREDLAPDIRTKIDAYEKSGIYGPDGAYLPEYERLVGEAQLPYNYQRPPPSVASAYHGISWDVLREMWVRSSDFVLDGNLEGFDFTRALGTLRIPTLVILGDHDLISIPVARTMQSLIPGSKLIVMEHSAHMTFVDDPATFLADVEAFLR